MVSIFIIGVLAALLLPAIQQARAGARRAQCVNNLKQIGLALQGYAATHGVFPPINLITGYLPEGGYYSDYYHSPFVRMLPQLEQTPLFNGINFAGSPTHSEMLWANQTVMMVEVGAFLCPSDVRSPVRGYGRVNYRFNLGPTPHAGPDPKIPLSWSGAFTSHRVYGPSDFGDGLSNTAGASERLQGDWTKGHFRPHGDYYLTDNSFAPTGNQDAAIAACAAAGGSDNHESRGGESWFVMGLHFTDYNHCMTPNSKTPDCSFDSAAEDMHYRTLHQGVITATSLHPGGVNLLLMDGSVRFAKEAMERHVWRAIATRSGGEVVSSDAY